MADEKPVSNPIHEAVEAIAATIPPYAALGDFFWLVARQLRRARENPSERPYAAGFGLYLWRALPESSALDLTSDDALDAFAYLPNGTPCPGCGGRGRRATLAAIGCHLLGKPNEETEPCRICGGTGTRRCDFGCDRIAVAMDVSVGRFVCEVCATLGNGPAVCSACTSSKPDDVELGEGASFSCGFWCRRCGAYACSENCAAAHDRVCVPVVDLYGREARAALLGVLCARPIVEKPVDHACNEPGPAGVRCHRDAGHPERFHGRMLPEGALFWPMTKGV